MFDEWLEESQRLACETGYKHPTTGKMLAGPEAAGGVVELDESAFEQLLRQVLLAGERIAIVLNDILDAKGAKKLHEGSTVKTNADEEEKRQKEEWAKEAAERRKKEKQQSRGTSSVGMDGGVFLTNLFIAAVTVPAFLVFVNYGFDPRSLRQALASLTEGGSGGGS